MNPNVVVQPVQWASLKDIHAVEPISEADADVLGQLREVLISNKATDRFGVMLIHKHFDLQENEQLVEFTDIESRRLTIRPVSDLEDIKTIETSWKFSADADGMEVNTVCVSRCFYDSQSTPQHVNKHMPG
jgi:hypothetical protein